MLNYKMLVPVMTLALVAACGDKDSTETGDTATATTPGDDDDDDDNGGTPGPLMIDTLDIPTCVNGAWIYHAETINWTNGSNLVNAWEAAAPLGNQWNEEHDLPSVDFGDNYAFDILELSLVPGVAFADYTQNVNTLYTCGGQGAGNANVYTFRVYDIDNNYADCAIFSDGVPGGVDDVFNGNVDESNTVTARSEINATDCVDFTR